LRDQALDLGPGEFGLRHLGRGQVDVAHQVLRWQTRCHSQTADHDQGGMEPWHALSPSQSGSPDEQELLRRAA
jgi:hypothetical protein